MTMLDQLADYARLRVEKEKEKISFEEMKDLALNSPFSNGQSFYDAMEKGEMSYISEVKKASPSNGIIDPVFDYRKIALDYEKAGADAISCLTEPKWFLGSDAIFCEIRDTVGIPMLRKDFVVDEYQVYQSRLMGADCILLICSLLDAETIRTSLDLCEKLGMAALVETHDEEEVRRAVSAGAGMIGVNNRNLKDFSVDLDNVARLRDLIPAECLYIAESGVMTAEDAALVRAAGADAVLIGEAMMRAPDKESFLREMKKRCCK